MGHPPYSPDLASCDFSYFVQLNLAERKPILPQLKRFSILLSILEWGHNGHSFHPYNVWCQLSKRGQGLWKRRELSDESFHHSMGLRSGLHGGLGRCWKPD
ncbi:hypothetical protein TNCV_3753861 [Trichonephila clavipes]|nr:hypothetical protein TNCV_3753861 [Trichonephila clavipes]